MSTQEQLTSSEQARADALADAATLRAVAADTFPATSYFDFWGVDGIEVHAQRAREDIAMQSDAARYSVSMLTRRAFRAVPALREE